MEVRGLVVCLAVVCLTTHANDLADLASRSVDVKSMTKAVLPDGLRLPFSSTGKKPPQALDANPSAALHQDGQVASDMPEGTQKGPASDFRNSWGRTGSYEWETSLDMYSPLLFNWKFYAAKYKLFNETEAAVRADWASYVARDEKYPNCRQAQPLFSANKYMLNNQKIKANIGDSCSGALRSYLGQGIFEGLNGEVGVAYQPIVKVSKGVEFPNQQLLVPAAAYTLTWWHLFENAGGGNRWRSILRYGNVDEPYPKSPAVLQFPSTLEEPNTRLSFTVGHTNDPDFHCNPTAQLPTNKWSFVAMVVERSAVSIYYNGQLVCQNSTSTGGSTLEPSGQSLFLGDPFHSAAYAKVKDVTYYLSLIHISEPTRPY
eukprot:TRINITY_DN16944_c0_g1_i1.p1 TRINITY_DN16944_c0_g1~~TRINITY_DN16944_c0_g1_i1.p1  ORF type:complete len:373 (+),score=77.18 TRINITY_DN16944_c0_g1_i1:201-1319(+)